MALLSFLVALAGAGVSLQAGVNSQLQAHWAKSPFLASFISFSVGTLGLSLLVALTGTPIPPPPESVIPWHWTGGAFGAFLVTITIIAAPRLGATTMIALILAGQIGAGLVLDHFGALGYAQRSISMQRLAGAALLGFGVYHIQKQRAASERPGGKDGGHGLTPQRQQAPKGTDSKGGKDGGSAARLALSLVTIAAGSALSFQAGINLQLQRSWAQSPLLTACVSFLVGTLTLLAVVLLTRTRIPPLPRKPVPWHWTGGLFGAFLVSMTIIAAPRLGATAMIALILAGQIGISLVLDHFGLVGYARKSLSARRLAGAFCLCAGVLLIQVY